jgi:hypothetical protein
MQKLRNPGMKRAFQLPLTQAILNAQPSQRQVDRLAAPLRRRGAWSQFIEARISAPDDSKRNPGDTATESTSRPPNLIGNGAGLPKGKSLRETHPKLSLKQRLQLIIRDQSARRSNETSNPQASQPPPGVLSQPPPGVPSQPPSGVPSRPPSGAPSRPPSGAPSRPPSGAQSRPPSGAPSQPPPAAPSQPQRIDRNAVKKPRDFAPGDAYFDLAFDPGNLPTDTRAKHAQPARPSEHARPNSPAKPSSPANPNTPARPTKPPLAERPSASPSSGPGNAVRPGPAATARPAKTAPPAARQAAPTPQQPQVRTKTGGARVAAQARRTLIEASKEEHHEPPQPAVARKGKVRVLGRFVALTLVVALIGGGIHFRERFTSLPDATARAVGHWKALFLPSRRQDANQLTLAKATLVESAPFEIVSTRRPAASLPGTYGIFAISDGRPIRLEPTNIRLPDSRIAFSGLITKPPTVVVPDGRLSFVAYQRELMTSAPDNAQLRVVAKVARAISFSTTGKPTVSAVDDSWAIRSISVDLTVAPIPENREMVALQPASLEVALSPGRYLLVFKNQAYDFVIAGRPTDKAHCLEKAETQDGDTFAECRKLP